MVEGDWATLLMAAEHGLELTEAIARPTHDSLRSAVATVDETALPEPPANALPLLCWLVITHPGHDSDWYTIARLLKAPTLGARERQNAIEYLLSTADAIPAASRASLAAALREVEEASAGGNASWLALAAHVGTVGAREYARRVDNWLLSGDTTLVRAAARACVAGPTPSSDRRRALAMTLLATTEDPEAAALGATLALRKPGVLDVDVVAAMTDRRGRRFAMAVATALSGQRSPTSRAVLERLRGHPSAAVRASAARRRAR